MSAQRHQDAWRIPAEVDGEYGVLVKCGPPEYPYWWLLCPATATLYLTERPGGGFDLRGCNDGSCVWTDVHDRAHTLVGELS